MKPSLEVTLVLCGLFGLAHSGTIGMPNMLLIHYLSIDRFTSTLTAKTLFKFLFFCLGPIIGNHSFFPHSSRYHVVNYDASDEIIGRHYQVIFFISFVLRCACGRHGKLLDLPLHLLRHADIHRCAVWDFSLLCSKMEQCWIVFLRRDFRQ